MALAANVHESLFPAIEKRFATDGDLLQLCGRLYVDFVPEKDEEGNEPSYPLVCVKQGEEGGSVEPGPGGKPVFESFSIMFEITASTLAAASQIAWQIARNFGGDADNDEWTGEYDGVTIMGCDRVAPPSRAQIGQGECQAAVGFVVQAYPTQTTTQE